MHINRGLVFWGLALVTAGVVALAVQQGYVDRDALTGLWRLWPVVLIAIGLSIMLSRTPFALLGSVVAAVVVGAAGGVLISVGPVFAGCGGPDPTSTQTGEGEFTGESASVDLDFSCGTLQVSMTRGAGWRVESARDEAGHEVRLEATGNSLSISSPDRGLTDREERWHVSLGEDVTYALTIDVNAATSTLNLAGGAFTELSIDPNAGSLMVDLRGTTVESLDLSMNAGSATLLVDTLTDLGGSIGMNAGSLELCAGPETAMRITIQENLTLSHDLDETDLAQSGDSWTSDGFETAEHKTDLRLEGNAASFSLNPEGGCE